MNDGEQEKRVARDQVYGIGFVVFAALTSPRNLGSSPGQAGKIENDASFPQ
jgi:hypothetical protein